MKKIILFGGTFDPIHNGHLAVAKSASQQINASKVIFIPARRSPHKHQKPFATDDDRLAMLKLAVTGDNLFDVSAVELNRGEPSYTIDTVRLLKKKMGEDCEFYWLLGADMLKDLMKWHKISELINECSISIMNRGGFDRPNFDGLPDKLRQNQIQTPLIDISSTEIRRKIANEQDIRELVAPEVSAYIQKHKLYTLDHQLKRNEEF
ncbi:MAG: nicotinate-nucleotide adenylyltransferase [Phycisphaerae bacterium]|nr:MAG: nicotinate (nicotinamide) nucleotide adenylyltransferase [Planctomycetes bacterium GWC2_45_44]